MTPSRRASWTLALALAFGMAAAPVRAAEVRVSAASSLTEAIQEASAAWAGQGGDPVVFNFGASSLLARQIAEGAPADLFFSADEARMDDLAARNLIDGKSRKSLLSNTLVFVVSAERGAAVASPEDLLKSEIQTIALGETRSVPAGIYAREFLEKKGLWDRVRGKVVPTENVRAALAAVEAGNADVAVVYKTDAMISKKVRVAHEVSVSDGPRISYAAAVLAGAKNAEGARRFLAFLGSPSGIAVFQKHGFLVAK
ncbi:MAG: molybdate ABC transporter substrate-binding protein [Acidobacteriota bacterium]